MNPIVCGCKFFDALDDANKLANTLLLVLPVLVEVQLPLQLPVTAVSCGGELSKTTLESLLDLENSGKPGDFAIHKTEDVTGGAGVAVGGGGGGGGDAVEVDCGVDLTD